MRRGEVERGSKTALVTGASTGIGHCYAEQLAELGYNLIVVSRSEDKLQELAAELESKYGVKVTVHAQDLAQLDSAEQLYAWTKEQGFVVDVLINTS